MRSLGCYRNQCYNLQGEKVEGFLKIVTLPCLKMVTLPFPFSRFDLSPVSVLSLLLLVIQSDVEVLCIVGSVK